ncbi:hypothetical protein PAXINDRAFT_103390, partial [Paxillus involutus ATCC 200175]
LVHSAFIVLASEHCSVLSPRYTSSESLQHHRTIITLEIHHVRRQVHHVLRHRSLRCSCLRVPCSRCRSRGFSGLVFAFGRAWCACSRTPCHGRASTRGGRRGKNLPIRLSLRSTPSA